MNLALTVLEIVAPVFLLAAVGYAWVRLGFEYRIEFVTQLSMTLGVPCLIFVSLMKTDIDPQALTALTLSSVVAYGAVTLAAWALIAAMRLDRRTWLAPVIFGNTGNLGLPLALFAFGETGLDYAVVVFAVMAVWSFTFGVWLVAGGGSPWKVVKEPLVGATLLGGLFLWQGWETPLFLTNTLSLIGQMAIPLMLITLGVAVARLDTAGDRGLGAQACARCRAGLGGGAGLCARRRGLRGAGAAGLDPGRGDFLPAGIEIRRRRAGGGGAGRRLDACVGAVPAAAAGGPALGEK